MKSTDKIKKELHEYIDRINDDETLWLLHEEVGSLVKTGQSKKEEEDYLTGKQEKQLDEAIRQADAGEFITEEEYLNATAKWRTNKED
jgi:hypothetical protein